MSTDQTPSADVDRIVADAAIASAEWKKTPSDARAAALVAVGDALDARADELVALAQHETHLAEARLRGELKRTTFQLRLFGEVLAEGSWLDARIDHADPEWPMGAPRPDLRRQLESIGPVLVFAASNFPFAFSVAGGDSASALAAGSAVVLKAHPGHPELSALTTRVVSEALAAAGAPPALFQTIFGTDAGVRALRASEIKAAAFTGSIAGGRALLDIANARDEPIPFFGELGSVNPVFVTRAAADARGEALAGDFLASVMGSAGQLCTKPGVLFVPEGAVAVERLTDASALPSAGPLLNDSIAQGFARSVARTRDHEGVAVAAAADDAGGTAPVVFRTTIDRVLADADALLAEMFGPAALVVEYADEADLIAVAGRLEGQLTATIIAEDGDEIAPTLIGALAQRAGRVLWNQWPTGVSVTWAQQHGGPYPATTAVGTTSVGTAAMGRFLRPVAYQGLPDHLLPDALKESNPLRIPRRVDGAMQLADR
ncbi:aldehyde dehydrogenase (NADP(+)) [Microbacterium sp. G2-8]|uniref:aldehyde dehydrogenase (NADP(+)) n=1 Tax=Microbacterium sp. G2-8 TaxID=2842454 RepID=UPI001C892D59|nr:aldehyde dehydrogenase (NADP(+)) [Microbacterium sp. G2-8]